MAVSLAFGIAFATMITLVIIPALVKIRSQIGALLQRKTVMKSELN
jgi:hypothetical protein